MILGVLIAFFYQPELMNVSSFWLLLLGVVSTCLVASSNYVINELLDSSLDRFHPLKKNRPAAQGLIVPSIAITEWLVLGAVGIGLGFLVNGVFGLTATLLWVMGCLYNIPPFRTKEIPYLDVVSESFNNPIRLMLGWSALIPDMWPPITLVMAYWMTGAFFMATKRFAEYRQIDDKSTAAAYRKSFSYYDDERLLVSMMFYVAAAGLFGGIFIVRYKLELILSIPLIAGFFAYYIKLGLRPESPVQAPEKLYRERGFFLYGLICVLAFVVLMMFVEIPALYDFFNVERGPDAALWRI